jgi:pyrroloquinoline-quinone synthase
MTTEWFEAVKTELLSANPFRESEYFKRFAAGALSREQAWGHVSQWYFLICWFPRMFSGIHSRCDVLEVRKDCARHLLVEDLGYFRGRIGGTPDHVELYQRIGDDMGYPRDAWERVRPMPEMRDIVAYFHRLAHDIPWSASLCTTAFIEAEVVEVARTVGRALAEHYGCRPEWGAMNYLVHEEVEREEAGETEGAILKYIAAPGDRRAAEQSMREMHRLLDAYAKGLERAHLSSGRG